MTEVVIIGAGIAGLACGRRLVQAGLQPVLFDKWRGIGGRVATRRVDGLQFDHGAQFVTASGDGFAALVRDITTAGAAAPWSDRSGRARIVGTPGMSSLAEAMAVGLDRRQGVHVTAIRPSDGGWSVHAGETDHLAARVVVTVPSPQLAALLGTDHPLVAKTAGVQIDPCLTLMAAVTASVVFETREDPDDELAWIACDGSKPGRPTGDALAWVVQAGVAFSLRHLEDDAATFGTRMLALLCDRLGVAANHGSCPGAWCRSGLPLRWSSSVFG